MSEPIQQSAAVQIAERHQSSPREHWADKEIMKAAEEIDAGTWKPAGGDLALDNVDDIAIALRAGTAKDVQRPVTDNDFDNTRNSLILGEHPRVIEAMRRMEQERDDAKTPQEYIEKTAMLFELNQASQRGNKWDGQERWEGQENEEMRYGLVLSPMQFYRRLLAVLAPGREPEIGELRYSGKVLRVIGANARIFIGRDAVKTHPMAESARVPVFVIGHEKIAVLMPGQRDNADNEPMMVATLQWPLSTEWMVMRFDQFGVPTKAKYLGWRTALLTMIRAGVLTEQEAHKAFPVRPSSAASWYRQQLWEWNNKRPA